MLTSQRHLRSARYTHTLPQHAPRLIPLDVALIGIAAACLLAVYCVVILDIPRSIAALF